MLNICAKFHENQTWSFRDPHNERNRTNQQTSSHDHNSSCGVIMIKVDNNNNHRLNGSSSPVLTGTCLSYGSLCDFLTFFPEPTWRSHPSTDFDAKWLKRRGFTYRCAFWGKNHNFLKPLTLRPPKPPKFATFRSGLRKFSLDFAFNIGAYLEVSRVNTP